MKLAVLLALLPLTVAYQQFCRCEYNEETQIHDVDQCNLCTTQFCLDRFGATFNETTDTLVIGCFQIESLKESVVIYLFILLVLGLLAVGYYKSFY